MCINWMQDDCEKRETHGFRRTCQQGLRYLTAKVGPVPVECTCHFVNLKGDMSCQLKQATVLHLPGIGVQHQTRKTTKRLQRIGPESGFPNWQSFTTSRARLSGCLRLMKWLLFWELDWKTAPRRGNDWWLLSRWLFIGIWSCVRKLRIWRIFEPNYRSWLPRKNQIWVNHSSIAQKRVLFFRSSFSQQLPGFQFALKLRMIAQANNFQKQTTRILRSNSTSKQLENENYSTAVSETYCYPPQSRWIQANLLGNKQLETIVADCESGKDCRRHCWHSEYRFCIRPKNDAASAGDNCPNQEENQNYLSHRLSAVRFRQIPKIETKNWTYNWDDR